MLLILFLFYNANLVKRQIINRGRSVAFIDNYIAWVVGESAKENVISIKEIDDHALAWELRSRLTFKGKKTAFVYFMRNSRLQYFRPINIKDTEIFPRAEIKILGVLIDSKLRYKNHIKKISYKGLKAAFTLKRMRVLTLFLAY